MTTISTNAPSIAPSYTATATPAVSAPTPPAADPTPADDSQQASAAQPPTVYNALASASASNIRGSGVDTYA